MTIEERLTRLEKQIRVLQQIVFRLDKGAKKRHSDMGLSRTAAPWVGLDEYRNPVEGDNASRTAANDTGKVDATDVELVGDGTEEKLCPTGED